LRWFSGSLTKPSSVVSPLKQTPSPPQKVEPKLKGTDILITGGYRTVGRRVPADLAPDYAGCVVEGWSAEEVAQLVVDLGHGGRERQVDVGDCGTYWPGE
jgi:hypothetical protein